MRKIKCRICDSSNVKRYGSTFCYESNISVISSNKRELYRCNLCKSISVEPVPTQQELSYYYEHYSVIGKGKHLATNRTSSIIIQRVASLLGQKGKVLDIGCGFGEILASLPPSFEKFGLDMSLDACKGAATTGAKVLCSSWELTELNTEFDLVIALDFLEHVNNAREALYKIGKFLRRGGYVVVETGNADSWAAKTLGEDWWYPAVYGHIQVLSPNALTYLAKNAHIEAISLTKGNHSSEAFNLILYRGMLAYGFHILRLVSSALKSVKSELYPIHRLLNRAPPAATLRDHMILIGQKQA